MIARLALQCDIASDGGGWNWVSAPADHSHRACRCWVFVASTRPSIAFSQTRIIAVGDLHGDYDAWIAIARASGLINSNGHWAAGKTTLVQLGDVLDREPNSLKNCSKTCSNFKPRRRDRVAM